MHNRFEMGISGLAGRNWKEIPVTGKDWAGNELL